MKLLLERLPDLLPLVEEWRPVVGYEDFYEVSSTGKVRSLDRITPHGHRRKGRELKLKRQASGHLRVGLSRDGEQKFFFVHRLVVEAFRGEIVGDLVVRHLGDQPDLNFLPTLEAGTYSDNKGDAMPGGRDCCPRGHTLEGKNLMPSKLERGWRGCRACDRAKAALRNNGLYRGTDSGELKLIADTYYYELVE